MNKHCIVLSSHLVLLASCPRPCPQVPPSILLQRMEALQLEMFLPRRQALSMVLRQPQLLLYKSETLQVGCVGGGHASERDHAWAHRVCVLDSENTYHARK